MPEGEAGRIAGDEFKVQRCGCSGGEGCGEDCGEDCGADSAEQSTTLRGGDGKPCGILTDGQRLDPSIDPWIYGLFWGTPEP